MQPLVVPNLVVLGASLSLRIVDLVSTGRTLKDNGLVETDTIMAVSSRLIVNRAAFKTRAGQVVPWVDRFRAAVGEPRAAAVMTAAETCVDIDVRACALADVYADAVVTAASAETHVGMLAAHVSAGADAIITLAADEAVAVMLDHRRAWAASSALVVPGPCVRIGRNCNESRCSRERSNQCCFHVHG